MFKLQNGREEFFQWDLNQRLLVSDPTVDEVHFCNRTDDCSLVCEVYEEDGVRMVNVPNILLQDSWDIRAYAYCSCFTKVEERFKVKARMKPADYIYTETEMVTVEKAVALAIEQAKAEGDFKGEPGEPGMPGEKGEKGDSGVYVGNSAPTDDSLIWINPEGESIKFATEEYVDNAIANIDIPESGGGSGDGIKTYSLVGKFALSELTNEDKAALAEIWAYCKANGTAAVAKDYKLVFGSAGGNIYTSSTWVISSAGGSMYAYSGDDANYGASSKDCGAFVFLLFNTSTGALVSYSCRGKQYAEDGGSDWNYTTDLYDSSLYNAKEIYIHVRDDNTVSVLTSHLILDNVLGDFQNEDVIFPSASSDYGVPYWRYNGSYIELCNLDNTGFMLIAYKA